MADRALLDLRKVEAFKRWLDEKGIEHRPGKGRWEMLQVHVNGAWPKLYSRLDMVQHVTVQEALVPLVHKFIDEGRKARKAQREAKRLQG